MKERFSIPGEVSFCDGEGSLGFVDINNDYADARLCLQGGQVLAWTPKGQAPVIWLSPQAVFAQGKAIRGGIPICWPWFGPHPTNAAFPAHGIARTAQWEVVATEQTGNATKLLLQLPINETMKPFWPNRCKLQLAISVGETLNLELKTKNTGSEPFTITEALHTYFAVSDINDIAVNGLHGVEYEDKVHGGRHTQTGPLTFDGETDRVYFNTSSRCEIEDKGLKRKIVIEKSGSQSTVVWNPWAEKSATMGDMTHNSYLQFVCVESSNALDDRVTILPGHEHLLRVCYSIATL
jgi:glucose-6-phosphate 1-epimerase